MKDNPANRQPKNKPKSKNKNNKDKRLFTVTYRRAIETILSPLVAIIFSLFFGGIFILIAGENPLRTYIAMINGSLGSIESILLTLRRMAPLIVAGLAASIAFRAGIFNLGIEGSLWVGGLASTLAGIYITGLPRFVHIPVALIIGAIIGGLWSLPPVIAYVKYKVDVVVFTLMLNYIAILIVRYLIRYYFLDTTRLGLSFAEPETRYILPSAQLPLISSDFNVSTAIVISIVLVILFYFLFKRSIWGFENYLTGLNRIFAKYSGIPIQSVVIIAMVLSGALAGVSGALDVLGVHHKFFGRFAIGIGFDGITIALMGKLNPIGVLLSAFFLSALKTGGTAMERQMDISRNVVVVIQGLVLLFVTADLLYERLKLKRSERVEE